MKGYVKTGLIRAEMKADLNQVTVYISENFKLKETQSLLLRPAYFAPE